MAILNATQSLPTSSVNHPVVIIHKPYPGLGSIPGQKRAAPQVQVDTLQLSSVTQDCASPTAGLESDSSSMAYTSMTILPDDDDKPHNEETHVPALVEAIVSSFFQFLNLNRLS